MKKPKPRKNILSRNDMSGLTRRMTVRLPILLATLLLSACGSTTDGRQPADDISAVDMGDEAFVSEAVDDSEDTGVEQGDTEETEDIEDTLQEEGESEMIDKIEVFTQSSIRIKCSQGTIYFDPYQMTEAPHDADFIFLTHDHYDHYSPDDIAKVMGEHTTIIAPEKMAETVAAEVSGYEDVVAVGVGIFRSENGLEFDTVASYNQLKSFHPKSSGWVGYIVRIDGQRIYVAGDTDATKEAKQVKCDIALVPIGGTYTMDAKKAAELINEIRPTYAVPTHFGSIVGKPEDADTFEKLVKDPVKVVKKIKF